MTRQSTTMIQMAEVMSDRAGDPFNTARKAKTRKQTWRTSIPATMEYIQGLAEGSSLKDDKENQMSRMSDALKGIDIKDKMRTIARIPYINFLKVGKYSPVRPTAVIFERLTFQVM